SQAFENIVLKHLISNLRKFNYKRINLSENICMNDFIKRQKIKLREEMLDLRRSFPLKDKRVYDKNICDSLKKIILLSNPKVIHSYLPIKGEIDITPLLKWAIEKNIKIVCPKVLPERQLENLELLYFDDFDYGPFNTIHPAGNKKYNGLIDFIIT